MEVISIEFSQRRGGLATFRLQCVFILEAIKHSLQNPRCSGTGVRGAVAASFTDVSPCSAHHAPYLTALPPADRAAAGVRTAPLTTHQSWTCCQSSHSREYTPTRVRVCHSSSKKQKKSLLKSLKCHRSSFPCKTMTSSDVAFGSNANLFNCFL